MRGCCCDADEEEEDPTFRDAASCCSPGILQDEAKVMTPPSRPWLLSTAAPGVSYSSQFNIGH